MRAKALLFDKDGTLLDFQRTWAPWSLHVVDLLSDGDHELAARMDAAWGLDRGSQRILADSIVIAGTVAEVGATIGHFRPDMSPAEVIAFLDETGAKAPAAPVLPLNGFLDQLVALGIHFGVATNDSEAVAHAQLGSLGVAHRFDFIAGYDSGFGGKPAPGMCLAYVNHVGLNASDIAMVGDSVHDLEAGRAAGMQTVAVLTGVANREELAPFADWVLPDVGHLVDWLHRD